MGATPTQHADPALPLPEGPAQGEDCWKTAFRKLIRDERGTTSLEWALLLGAIALPSVYLFTMSLGVIVDYYRMMTQISSLPLP